METNNIVADSASDMTASPNRSSPKSYVPRELVVDDPLFVSTSGSTTPTSINRLKKSLSNLSELSTSFPVSMSPTSIPALKKSVSNLSELYTSHPIAPVIKQVTPSVDKIEVMVDIFIKNCR